MHRKIEDLARKLLHFAHIRNFCVATFHSHLRKYIALPFSNLTCAFIFFSASGWKCPFAPCSKCYQQQGGLLYHLRSSHLPASLAQPSVCSYLPRDSLVYPVLLVWKVLTGAQNVIRRIKYSINKNTTFSQLLSPSLTLFLYCIGSIII